MHSRERRAALKRDKYTCQICGKKQSKAKGREQMVEVHHIVGINIWDEVIGLIFDKILCNPEKLKTLCPECHADIEKKPSEIENFVDNIAEIR